MAFPDGAALAWRRLRRDLAEIGSLKKDQATKP
jgi:hypothetical protein